jgi:hypothetical protein
MANLVSNIDGVLEIWDDGTVNIVGGKLQIDSSDVLNNNNNALFSDVRVDTLDFGDASPTLSDDGDYLKIQTTHGYTSIGAGNTSFSHFYTDRYAFYFDKRVQVNSGQVRSHDEDLNLNRAGSTTARLRLTSGTTISDQDLSVTGDVTISGDLTVSGDTVTLNTTTITAEDAVILLNSGQTTPANDIGLIFQRYSTATSANYNPVILWEESSDKFVLGSTTEAAADADIGLDQQWLVVTGSGNVGIGSNTPGDSLVVSNGTTPTVYIGDKDTAKHANLIINRGSTSFDANLIYKTGNVTKWRIWLDGIDNTLQVRDEANASNIMTWETGGNVGINVDDPNAILHIKDGTTPGTAQWDYRVTANFEADNGNTSHLELIQIRDSGGVNDWTRTGTRLQQRIDTTYMGYMQFNGVNNTYGISWGSGGGTAGPEATTEKMRLDQNGNLSIITGKLILNDVGYSIGNEYHKWKRVYSVTTSSPQELLDSDGNSLATGGVYRFTAHISGTGTDQFATAVYWNQNGTWRINVTGQSGTSSNHPEFIIDGSTNKPTIHIDHPSTYSINILGERIELDEGSGTDNAGFGFGTDAFLGSVNNNLYFLPGGTAATGQNSYDDGNIVWHAGNDGSGSGLDADLLDGLQSSSYLRSDADDGFSGNLTSASGGWIKYYHSSETDSNDGKIGSGIFSSGLNIVGTQTSSGTGRQVRIWGDVITDAGNKFWHAGNDGAGSGLDADTVDGVQLTGLVQRDFQDSSRNLNIATGSTSAAGLFMKASDNAFRFQLYGDGSHYGFLDGDWASWDIQKVINGAFKVDEGSGLKRVWNEGNDGAGSGLDADLLDGQHGSYYMPASTTTISQSNQVTGNAFATTSSPGGVLEYQQASGLTDTKLAPGTDWYNSIRMGHGNPYSYYSNTIAVKMTGSGVGTLYTQTISNNNAQGWNKHWHDNNDGAGSGLDADTVDGIHASGFATSSHDHTILKTSGNYVWSNSTTAGSYPTVNGSPGVQTSFVRGTDGWPEYGAVLHVGARGGTDAGGDFQLYCGHGSANGGNYLRVRNADNSASPSDSWTSWRTIWDSGNDGSGSGLDADLLDGVQGSSYLRSDADDTMTGNLTIDSTDAWNAGNGMLNVGGASDGRIQVRHIWGKDASSAGTDHLWLNYSNASKHVQIGASGGGNDLYVAGSIYEGGYFTGNRVLTTATGVGGGEYHNYGTISIGSTVTTTALLITDLTTKGFFNQNHSVGKCSWSYAGNGNLSDTGFGTFELAGCVVETFKDGSYKTVRITRPNTGSDGPSVLVYNDQGSSYNPGWREMVTSYNGTTNITGQIRATSDITAYYSDERLKDISGKIENALDKVCSLNGYHYTGNEAAGELGYDTDVQQVGISAQEVEAVLPEVVKSAPINDTHDTDYKTVQYERLIPLLIESIKEQQTQIDQLKDMVKKLTQK